MSFLTQIYDFMFAPAGAFDSDSSSFDTRSDCNFVEDESMMVNPATNMPMREGTGGTCGIDVLGNPYGLDLTPHQEDFVADHSTMFGDDDCSYAVDHYTSFF